MRGGSHARWCLMRSSRKFGHHASRPRLRLILLTRTSAAFCPLAVHKVRRRKQALHPSRLSESSGGSPVRCEVQKITALNFYSGGEVQWRQKCFSLFSIALHNRDSPTDVIPRPGQRTRRHPFVPSAASPFGTRCLAFDVRTLVGRASIFHMKLLVLYTLICACQGVICVFNAKKPRQSAASLTHVVDTGIMLPPR